jgi:hypothetical protein
MRVGFEGDVRLADFIAVVGAGFARRSGSTAPVESSGNFFCGQWLAAVRGDAPPSQSEWKSRKAKRIF